MFIGTTTQIYLAKGHVDFRKSFQGLSIMVESTLRQDVMSGHLFVFFNKRRDEVKILYWDHNGFCLWCKRLEQDTFKVWDFTHTSVQIKAQDLQLLLSGFDIRRLKRGEKAQRFLAF